MQRPFNMFIYCSKYQPLFITKTRRCKASIPCVQYLRYQQRNKFCISLLLGICSHIHINAHFLNNRFICICNPPPQPKKKSNKQKPKRKTKWKKTPKNSHTPNHCPPPPISFLLVLCYFYCNVNFILFKMAGWS